MDCFCLLIVNSSDVSHAFIGERMFPFLLLTRIIARSKSDVLDLILPKFLRLLILDSRCGGFLMYCACPQNDWMMFCEGDIG